MTDPDLIDAVDRWLVAEVRTNWPNIAADCLDADERAEVAAWFATEMTRFDRWRREQGSGGTAVAGGVEDIMWAPEEQRYVWSDGTTAGYDA